MVIIYSDIDVLTARHVNPGVLDVVVVQIASKLQFHVFIV